MLSFSISTKAMHHCETQKNMCEEMMVVVVLWEGSGPSVLPSLAEPFCTKSGVGYSSNNNYSKLQDNTLPEF
jgi:hypothetical protein